MRVYLIRHGLTQGNKRHAYIGAGTDEPLCEEGVQGLKARNYPPADIVFASPMRRCLMTAECIYPDKKPIVCEALREMDFGDFEGKSYEELKDNPAYGAWLESGGESAFPNGESKADFSRRTLKAFDECVETARASGAASAAFVVHGGSIMAIMEEYGSPKGEFYKWQVKNGEMIEMEALL